MSLKYEPTSVPQHISVTRNPWRRALHTAGALAAATAVVVLLSWNSGAPSDDAVALAQQLGRTQRANGQLLLASTMLEGEADPYDAMAAQVPPPHTHTF